ncbi:MAG: exopolysaccharide biosynthesis polyprenyl glycosylphosphotransferase [Elusimicrobiota bacterium]|nr:exopolysaccharide biosynthesis polyprenyl glycosylphosphotransferase [Endomicrobiia bacterium]MDW8166731.1 exopolysaccharide biosynthesis polyprenyl glycosylphosphotransferase [Elusimicrobiota bacterium]
MFLFTISFYLISLFIISKILPFPRIEHSGIIFTTVSISFLIIISIIALFRLYYSRSFLISSYILTLFWFIIGYYILKRKNKLIFAILPIYENLDLPNIDNVNFISLKSPNSKIKCDGIIISSPEKLTPEWSQYIVQQTLKGIPIFHISDIYEKLLGKIPLKYFYDEFLEDFQFSFSFMIFKRIFDILLVLIFSPIAILLGLIIAILIKIDSEGSIFFTQERVGQGRKIYKMIKFRTMYKDAEKYGPAQADKNDPRITKVGKFLRKFRLDEIPQFINVLKGEMSLIGPRPEQVRFVEEYEQKIPFYSYRYLVKPGITGWAQIHQGYASGVEENAEKLEYDLYYIKNLSIWLDLVITLKTIKVLISKWGAR